MIDVWGATSRKTPAPQTTQNKAIGMGGEKRDKFSGRYERKRRKALIPYGGGNQKRITGDGPWEEPLSTILSPRTTYLPIEISTQYSLLAESK